MDTNDSPSEFDINLNLSPSGVFMDLLFGALVGVWLLYLLLRFHHLYWTRFDIPYLAPSFPGGNINSLFFGRKNIGVVMKELYDNFLINGLSDIGGIYFFNRPSVMILNPVLAKNVLAMDNFQKTGPFHDGTKDAVLEKWYKMDADKWDETHEQLVQLFSKEVLLEIHPQIVECTNGLVHVLKTNDNIVDVRSLFADYVTDLMTFCIFGKRLRSITNYNFEMQLFLQKIHTRSYARSLFRIIIPSFPVFIQNLFSGQKMEELAFCEKILRDQIRARISTPSPQNAKDFLHFLLESERGKKLDNAAIAKIASKCFLLFLNSYEKLISTLTYCMYELAKNQHVQNKLREELANISINNMAALYEKILANGLPYLNRVVNETFRKYPINGVIQRECSRDCRISKSNFKVTKGTVIYVPVLGYHFNTTFFSNPDQFDPDRTTTKLDDHFAFGSGPRACIGKDIVSIQIRLAVASLIKKYQFSTCPQTVRAVEPEPLSYFLLPKHKIFLRVLKMDGQHS